MTIRHHWAESQLFSLLVPVDKAPEQTPALPFLHRVVGGNHPNRLYVLSAVT
ncbi:hypothetical protein ABLA30_21040 [Xenorhabdus nematophila]|uniref:hypothetical protein n=1 Tax=Xenorhabdus nematophila TaxID=628 RepID=UPI0032B7BE70